MTKVLVLYHSSYGHVEAMANAVAKGAAIDGVEVTVKRVPETIPKDIAVQSNMKLDQDAPIAEIAELPDYDAIIFGIGTRFGRLPAQMASFLDQAGGLWMTGALEGKVGSVFGATASQHGGQETTLFSMITNMMHFDMVITGLPYGFKGQLGVDAVKGGTPYGATTIVGDGSRMPSDVELEGASYQGRHVAELAKKLAP